MKNSFSNHPLAWIVTWSLLVHIPGILSPLRDYQAYRQTQTASMARNYMRHGMQFFSPEVDTEGPPARTATEFPIYSFLLALLFKYAGLHEVYGRLLSALFAVWGALYLFRFVRPRLGGRIALWSALALCSLPIHIYFTRTVQPEPMALWGFLGFLTYADAWLHRHAGAGAWWRALLMGSLAPLLKLPFLYLLIPLWFLLGYERFRWKVFLQWKWMSLLGCVLVLTESWYAYAKTAPIQFLPLTTHEHLENLIPVFCRGLWIDQFISRIPELVLTYSGLVLALLGIYYFRKAKSFLLLVLWSLASVCYVPLLGEYGHIHRYTLLPLSPITAIWVGCGISAALEHAKKNLMRRMFSLLLIVGVPLHAGLRIAHWYRLDYDYLSRAHDHLASLSHPSDLVLVTSHEKPTHLYYLDHYGYAIDPLNWTPASADAAISRGVRFIFLPMEDVHARLADWQSYLTARHAVLVSSDPDYLLYQIS